MLFPSLEFTTPSVHQAAEGLRIFVVIDETAKNQLKKTKLLGAATLFRVTKGYVNLDKNSIYLPRQYLSQSDGRVCDERPGEKGWVGRTVLDCLGGYQHGRNR